MELCEATDEERVVWCHRCRGPGRMLVGRKNMMTGRVAGQRFLVLCPACEAAWTDRGTGPSGYDEGKLETYVAAGRS